MSRYLTIDIGAGTMDILCWDSASGEHFKAVVMSPVRHIARHIEQSRGPLAVTGAEMGGGPVTEALKQRAAESEVLISPAAAATLHHDMERVKRFGMVCANDRQLARAVSEGTHTPIILADVQPARIEQIFNGLGVSMQLEAVALCAQDHGAAPKGVSHLDFRHNLFREMLDASPVPTNLLFSGEAVPTAFNRLNSIARDARWLNTREICVMDSGMAALAGAAQDAGARNKTPVVVLDIATSHTVVAALQGDQVAGMVEYHTRDVSLNRIESLIRELADGEIQHAQILAEGGHGAYLRETVGFVNIQAIIATGPKRALMAQSRLPVHWGAPWGDNMMTGTVGLLEAVRRKKGLAPFACI
ncbi:MAG: pyruvate formate-lyase activating enzyme [Desulfobacterales bacterium]|nr:pyruvate formate-lyase activating enzyme [Desulfobacterales bacterium]